MSLKSWFRDWVLFRSSEAVMRDAGLLMHDADNLRVRQEIVSYDVGFLHPCGRLIDYGDEGAEMLSPKHTFCCNCGTDVTWTKVVIRNTWTRSKKIADKDVYKSWRSESEETHVSRYPLARLDTYDHQKAEERMAALDKSTSFGRIGPTERVHGPVEESDPVFRDENAWVKL